MVIKQSDVLKMISEKHNVKQEELDKFMEMFEDCVNDYLTSVKEGEENVVFPFKGYKISSKLVKRKNSRGGRGQSVVVKANFTERFKDRINRSSRNSRGIRKASSVPWYL